MDNITIQNTANNPQQNEVHLLDYLNLLRKHKWLIISCLFITVTTVIIGNYTITPIYQAQSQLVLDKEGGRSIVTGRDLEYLEYESYLSEELTFNTQFKMVTSYPVLELVATNLNLKERYEKQKNLLSQQGNFSSLKVTLQENIETFKETLHTWKESIRNLFPAVPSDTTSQPQPALALTPEEKKKYEEDAMLTNQKEIQYAVLEREVETNQGIYEIMLNKLKETRINESMGKSSIRLIEPAALPKSPIKPKKKLNIILGIILGLMSGVGLVFLMEYMETNIKTDDDVKRYLQLPVLGIVPEAERASK